MKTRQNNTGRQTWAVGRALRARRGGQRSARPTLHSSKTDRFQEEGLKWYGIERSRWRCGAQSAFSLIEVMIATTIFFVAMFSILGVLSTGLHAAAILRNNGPTAGMAVAALTLTNQLEEGSESGDFGEIYPNYTWGLNKREIATNGLFQVDVTVLHSGQFYSSMSILLYKKEATHR